MKKILIISYHALPMDVVSSYRTKALCDHLSSFGIYPTLLTHRWEKDHQGNWKFHNEMDETVVESHNNYTVIRLPRRKPSSQINSALFTVINYFKGFLENELMESYHVFRKFLLEHLPNEKYDVLLTIYSPHFQMKLAREIKHRFGIPYITDFRDLWDNQVITKSYQPTIKKRAIDFFVKYWWKSWIKDSVFFTTTSESWKNLLKDISKKKGFVIRNGFEANSIVNQEGDPKDFIIVHFGRLYPNQNLSPFVQGFNLFVQEAKDTRIKLRIIGYKPKYGVDVEKILTELPNQVWSTHGYMNKQELFNYCVNKVSVFWMPGFTEDNGQFPVKVYDYLSLSKNILFTPKDGSDAQQVIEETGAGIACNTPAEVCNQLLRWFEEFKTRGYLPYSGKEDVIKKYNRVNQVKILAEKIHELVR